MELLGAVVVAAQGDEDGTLTIRFDNGRTLRVYDTSTKYESYIITYPGKDIIV
jgi:hypothetical protein